MTPNSQTGQAAKPIPADKDDRIEQILDALMRLGGKDFDVRLPVSAARDEVDAIMLSVNMLSEEMRSYTNELENSRRQVVQAAKLASLGEMASGLCHELNNPLFILTGFLQVISGQIETEAPELHAQLEDYLTEVRAAAERIRKIIDHMRDFSRQSTHTVETAGLNRLVQGSFTLLNQQLALRQISVEMDLAPGDIAVQVDKIKFEQVLVNLIANARDAIEEGNGTEGGVIRIHTRLEGGAAVLEFKDDGCGMDEETRTKIFDAFFTTKDVGKGTGLGMSVSFGILNSFGADISCESTPGQGTTFTIRMPGKPMQDKENAS